MILSQENMHNFSPSCERNKLHIAEQIGLTFANPSNILEIGSYSAQHALYFCKQMPHLNWQPSDTSKYIDGLAKNLQRFATNNIKPPLTLDVALPNSWPTQCFDGIFTANTLHIMGIEHVELFFKQLSPCLKPQGKFCVYGPFKYNGQYTSDSNEEFNQWLIDRDPLSAIRDFEQVNQWAEHNGLSLVSDTNMPANNQFIIWQKQG